MSQPFVTGGELLSARREIASLREALAQSQRELAAAREALRDVRVFADQMSHQTLALGRSRILARIDSLSTPAPKTEAKERTTLEDMDDADFEAWRSDRE